MNKEERFQLLGNDTRAIGNLRGRQEQLKIHGVTLRGYRVMHIKSG